MPEIETKRLRITALTMDMAQCIHENSLDADNRRFVPDEVFETVEKARETVAWLLSFYGRRDGPLLYPVLLKTGENIGYVQLVPLAVGWELGYHIATPFTGRGYAAEAVKAFLPCMLAEMELAEVYGICMAENTASRRILEKCGFAKEYEGVGPYQGRQLKICRYKYSRR